MKIEGIWTPLVTPFLNEEVDFKSYKKLIDHYIESGVTGIMPAATTGESPTLSENEYQEIIEKTVEYVNNRVPIYVGLGGNDTRKVVKQVKAVEQYKIEGILSSCPYYNRPDQKGIFEHFSRISEATNLNIVIYNIPYRTGRNIENETLYKLAELKNIVGLKDSCGDIKQTTELLLNPPSDFSILTGEDALFYTSLVLGGNGGVLASSHLNTEAFIEIYNLVKNNDHKSALEKWKLLSPIIPLLFKETNPGPIKYCLSKLGLIESPEVRLPLTEISEELKVTLDKFLSL